MQREQLVIRWTQATLTWQGFLPRGDVRVPILIVSIIVIIAAVVVGGWAVLRLRVQRLTSSVRAPSTPTVTQTSPPSSVNPSRPNTSSPPETPTPDPMADWLTYRNERYGYEVNYPRDWFANESERLVIFDSHRYQLPQDGQAGCGRICIQIFDPTQGDPDTIESLAANFRRTSSNVKEEAVIVGNNKALKLAGIAKPGTRAGYDGGEKVIEVLVSHGNLALLIGLGINAQSSDARILDDLLTTVKFF